MSPAQSIQQAMRAALLARAQLTSLLGGAHIYDETPRGANPPYVVFNAIETRDWSVADQKAHELIVTLEIVSNSRARPLAQNICNEIETALDGAVLTLTDHRLVNLRAVFNYVSKSIATSNFNGVVRFRAATEPL
jgi:Protein of unknown function (DUF3168)